MKINYVQRPCLGINQSSLFNVSDEMAQNVSAREEFLLHPDEYLGKNGVNLSLSCFKNHQKTSEICTGPLVICALAFALGVAVYNTAAIIMAVYKYGSAYTEWSGWGMNNAIMPGNSYVGIV